MRLHDLALSDLCFFIGLKCLLPRRAPPRLQQKARCSRSPQSIPKQKTRRSVNRWARTPPQGALAVGSVHRRSLESISGWQPSPVLWSDCGISAGSHRKGGSRDSHRWPRKVIPARQVRCSSGRATNTRLWVGRTQQPQLFSRLPAFWTFVTSWSLCRRLGLVFLCVTRCFSFSSDGEAG